MTSHEDDPNGHDRFWRQLEERNNKPFWKPEADETQRLPALTERHGHRSQALHARRRRARVAAGIAVLGAAVFTGVSWAAGPRATPPAHEPRPTPNVNATPSASPRPVPTQGGWRTVTEPGPTRWKTKTPEPVRVEVTKTITVTPSPKVQIEVRLKPGPTVTVTKKGTGHATPSPDSEFPLD